MSDFETDCRAKFQLYCECYQNSAYHSLKRLYSEKAYEVIDAFLDFRDVQGL